MAAQIERHAKESGHDTAADWAAAEGLAYFETGLVVRGTSNKAVTEYYGPKDAGIFFEMYPEEWNDDVAAARHMMPDCEDFARKHGGYEDCEYEHGPGGTWAYNETEVRAWVLRPGPRVSPDVHGASPQSGCRVFGATKQLLPLELVVGLVHQPRFSTHHLVLVVKLGCFLVEPCS